MNKHTDDPWEAEMSREFDHRVRDLHEAPLTFDHVKGKAMKIRRTRRVAVAGGVLAAAAVIVPVAVFAGQGLTGNDSGPPPADQTPNPTVTDPGSPGFGYLEGRTLHLADGSTVELPKRYDRASLLGETVLASRNDDDTGFDLLDVIDEAGNAAEAAEIVSGPVLNADHTIAAYVERDGDLVTRSEDGERVVASGLGTSAFVTAVTGCDAGGDACRVFVNGDFGTDPMVYDANGSSREAVPGAIKVNDADESGLVATQSESTDTGSCGGVYDTNVGEYLWDTCDYSLFNLSPDAKYVDASHPYLDGPGNAWAAVLDAATGTEVARLAPPEGLVTTTAWQDAEHLLATVYDPEGWSIYRLGVDGEVERVVGPSAQGDEVTPTYTLLGGS